MTFATAAKLTDAEFTRLDTLVKAHREWQSRYSELASDEVDAVLAANKLTGKEYTMEDRTAAFAKALAVVGPAPEDILGDFRSEIRASYYRESRRRQANASRLENAEKRAAAAVATGTYVVGEVVQVHAFGFWYNGKVTKLGKTGKVTVEYTSGTGVTREKAVDSSKVRKA